MLHDIVYWYLINKQSKMYCQWMYRNKLIHVYIRTHHQHNTKICPVFFSTNISQGKHTSVNVETVVIGKKHWYMYTVYGNFVNTEICCW